jgi:hypothetical protein
MDALAVVARPRFPQSSRSVVRVTAATSQPLPANHYSGRNHDTGDGAAVHGMSMAEMECDGVRRGARRGCGRFFSLSDCCRTFLEP